MLYVLARSEHDYREWVYRTGLPPNVVQLFEIGKGRQLAYHEIVRLDGFALNPSVGDIVTALIPCGIQPSAVAVAGPTIGGI